MVTIDLDEAEDSKQLAFQMLVCMRDVAAIAKKTSAMPTYERSLELFHDFSPDLYKQISQNLPQRNISDEAKVYVTLAEVATQREGEEVTALELLEKDIEQFENAFDDIDTSDDDNRKVLSRKIAKLKELKKSLRPRKLSENRILNKDNAFANRKDYGAQFIEGSDFFVDYKLSKSKYLRIRLLHPDEAEHITGADLIYEQHNENSGMMRILMLQYKTWDDGLLYFSEAGNLPAQVGKMVEHLCDNGFCNMPKIKDNKVPYRFPCCSGFLRPTDKLQYDGSKLVSSGVHIPICQISDLLKQKKKKITREAMGINILDQDLFEPLFNRGFIGSHWIPEKEVEEFYTDTGILQKDDTVTFFAREITQTSGDSYAETEL